MTGKTIKVDHHDRDIDQDGIRDFFWPVLHTEMTGLGERLMYASAGLLQNHPDQEQALIYKLTLKYLIAETGGLFQGARLRKEFQKSGITPIIPPDWAVWPYVFKDRAPPEPKLFEKLCRNKPINSWHKKYSLTNILKKLKAVKPSINNISIDGLIITKLTKDKLDKNIIAVQRTELISRHASIENNDVILSRSDRWFETIELDKIVLSEADRNAGIENSLLEMIRREYETHDLDFKDFIEDYLRNYISRLAAILRIHYRGLLRRDDLPKTIWTGTGGNIWDLMLRIAVMQKGGKAVGHDHGGGTNHVNVALVGFIELWGCSQFVTFNDHLAGLMKDYSSTWPLLDRTCPEIIAVTKSSNTGKKSGPVQRPVRRILLPTTLYDRDRGRSFAFYPDLVYIDWQARLIAKLQSWGYEVLFKPHPESQTRYPAAFEKKLGAHIINKPFEESMDDADLILMDYTYTSVFLPALTSHLPLVLVDFDNLNWHDGARALFEKRGALVEASFDEQNRVSIDWNALKTALETAAKMNRDQEFPARYF